MVVEAVEFKISDKEFELKFMRDHGYVRRQCEACDSFFWTVDPDAKFCGDSPCVDYEFIGAPPTRRRYTISEMRSAFLKFFERHGHRIVDPYPVVARWRDDLMVTIASIVDFQPYVTDGIIEPPANPLVVSQPCLRFEDIEHVGFTAGRHFTIFEMGGHHAFNFPQKPEVYWKNQTVELHHIFATEELGIPGDLIAYKEHFWSGGGNAGPDLEGSILGLEVSTLVFMQFKVRGEQLIPSPVRTVDTGYGIERWTWLSQGVGSAFEATYGGVMEALLKWAGVNIDGEILRKNAVVSAAYRLDAPESSNAARARAAQGLGLSLGELTTIMRPYEELSTVLDHSKALIFLLSEGAVASNVREGYLSRLLFRRLYRILMKYGVEDRLGTLVQNQIDYWGRDFKKLKEMEDEIFEMVEVEKNKYLETLRKGKALVMRMIKPPKPLEGIDVNTLIDLYDSHGLHPEIVKEVVEGEGIEVSIPYNFFSLVAKRHAEEERVREEERGVEVEIPDLAEERFETEPLYYTDPYMREFDAEVLYSKGPHVILDRTAFYPEGGGQRGDAGRLDFEGRNVRVTDTQRVGKSIVHVVDGEAPDVGVKVRGFIDWERRFALMRNHTATHILLGAAKRVLGKHVYQAGSDKTPEQARLDMTHYRRVTPEEIRRMEELSNEVVSKDLKINTFFMGRSKAERMYGTDIYQGGAVPGAEIRIVESEGWDVEACGGTHCKSAGELMMIKILGTERVQDGIERLTYTTGLMALKRIQETDKIVLEATEALGTSKEKLVSTAMRVKKELSEAREKMRRLRGIYVKYMAERIVKDAKKIRGVRTAIYASEEEEVSDLISIGEKVEKMLVDGIYVACSLKKGVNCTVFLGEKLIEKGLSALALGKMLGAALGGGAAGDERFARAGGRKTVDVAAVVEEYLRQGEAA